MKRLPQLDGGRGGGMLLVLATDSSSPYNDTRPVEWHDYLACWYDNDTASLAYGPVVRVLVQG